MLNPQALVKGTPQLASLPDLYVRLNTAIENPYSSFSHIGTIIAEDTSFSARLLRIVNSPMYGFPARIDTIHRAMTVVGTKQLRDLALSSFVIHQFDGLQNSFITMRSFWSHAICCACSARVLATAKREPNTERFFLLGILHDVGRLLLLNKAPQQCAQALDLAENEHMLLHKAERHIFSFDHADVGRALLNNWHLPPYQVEAVACHHRPGTARLYPLEASLLHTADLFANAMQMGSSGERLVPSLHDSSWNHLELSPMMIPDLLQHIEQQTKDMTEIFLES